MFVSWLKILGVKLTTPTIPNVPFGNKGNYRSVSNECNEGVVTNPTTRNVLAHSSHLFSITPSLFSFLKNRPPFLNQVRTIGISHPQGRRQRRDRPRIPDSSDFDTDVTEKMNQPFHR